MGLFDVFCAESGLVLAEDTQLILVAEGKEGIYDQISAPMSGCYNRLGAIDLPKQLDENGKLIERFCRTLKFNRAPGDDLDSILSDMRYGGVPWTNGARVSYALVDGEIFRAITRTVAQGGKSEWAAVAEGKLEGQDIPSLITLAFPAPEMARAIYQDLFNQPPVWLRTALIDLARFRAWRPHLEPVDCDTGGQFNGYSEDSNGDGAVEPFVEEARQKYAAFPLLLKAVTCNETHWRELD